jgi:hypothetical protein
VAALKVIPPLSITDSNLTSSNVAEADHAAYVAGTTYAIGNRVIVTTPNVHKIYESLQAGNIGHDPLTSPTWWIEVGPTNRWKMFDTSNTTQTTNSNSIVVTITPGRVVNSVALLGLEGTSVTIKVTDPIDGIVYNKTTSLNDNGVINNWYNYFFNPIVRRTDHVATDLPAYGTAVIEITITHTGSTAKCGTCVVGTTQEIGEGINLGASVGIQDYSRKEKNEFGDYVLVQRSWSKRAKFSMAVLNSQIDSLQAGLAKLRTTPCVWIGDPNYASTIIFGYYKDFDIIISNHIVSDCNIDIEGLT